MVSVCSSFGSVQRISTQNLNMRKVSAKWIPKLLTQAQKEKRVSICQQPLDRSNADADLLCKIVTGDETLKFPEQTQKKYSVPLEAHEWSNGRRFALFRELDSRESRQLTSWA
ncbi:hypothetical protein BC332_34939 [Capsicum chinense]|nr:hypothetical protein BC332_34939 [Capsicum chinense]